MLLLYNELKLPKKEKFFNKLNNRNVSNDDYEHVSLCQEYDILPQFYDE